MNFKDFTLLKEDGASYTVGHPEGSSIRVLKQGLSGKAQSLISKLKKSQGLADGGSPAPGDVGSEIPFDQLAQEEKAENAPYGIPSPAPASAETNSSEVPVSTSATIEQPQTTKTQDQPENTASAPTNPSYPDQSGALQIEKKTLQAGATAETQQGKENAQSINDTAMQQSLEKIKLMNEKDAADQGLQKVQAWFADPKNAINSNRVFQNMSVPSKITAGIAMILGGIGSGLVGGPNPAAEMIKEAVDRDIEDQKNAQSMQMNLYKTYQEKFGNDIAAHTALENTLYSKVKMDMMGAASRASGPEAAARIAPAISAIDQQTSMNNYRLGLMNVQSKGGVLASDPSQVVPIMTNNPETQKEALNEIGKKQYLNQNYDKIMQLYQQADKENTAWQRAGRLGAEPPSLQALRTMTDPLLKDKDGRINEIVAKHRDDMLPGIIEREKTAQDKTQNFATWLNQGPPAPVSKSIGIDLNKFQSTAPKAAPPLIKKMNGIPYQKVNGGWQAVASNQGE